MTTTIASQDGSVEDQAFRIEQHGIDYVPVSERWASPRAVGGMWAGASVQVEYFIYGAILMSFGVSFGQALALIIIVLVVKPAGLFGRPIVKRV